MKPKRTVRDLTGVRTKPAKEQPVNPRIHTLQEMCDILDRTIKEYQSSKSISYYKILRKHSPLSRNTWRNYLTHGKTPNKKIIDRFGILAEIQEDKAVDGAMSGTYNATFSAFLLRTRHGYVEQQHVDRLKFDRDKLEQGSVDDLNAPLNINFTVAEHRTEEEIDELLNGED